ncbi:FAD-dependent oxidoreductase [Streptomyces sp. NPDC019990]|uniref:NAD(P)/FAD-dependent oxidoreductase n=1 Tax=Streptomyces sp. NPDC019990 TaxID=3154693 RepID=UPI0033CFFE9D
MKTAVVVGGGIAGLSAAWELAKRGWNVRVCERADVTGAGCTRATLGLVYPLCPGSYAPEMVDVSFAGWRSYPAYAEEMSEMSGTRVSLLERTLLDVAVDQEELARVSSESAAYAARGFAGQVLGPAELEACEPRLMDSAGGVAYPGVLHADGAGLMSALASSLSRRGSTVMRNSPVRSLDVKSGVCRGVRLATGETLGADLVVLATGAAGFDTGDGPVLPVEAVRGQVILAEMPRPWLGHMVYVAGLDIIQRDDGTVLIGATRERGETAPNATIAGLASILNRVSTHLSVPPELRFTGVAVGLRPRSRTTLPVVQPLSHPANVVIFNGLFRNGMVCAPTLARLLVDAVESRDWTCLAAFQDPAVAQ